MIRVILALACLLWGTPALAQMATEPVPGITFYGGGTVVEPVPGVQFYSGAVSGSAVQIVPGITSYRLQTWQSDLERSVQSEMDRRSRYVDEEIQANERARQRMHEFLDRR